MEKIKKAAPGFNILLLVLILLIAGGVFASRAAATTDNEKLLYFWLSTLTFLTAFFMLPGFMVVQPNTSVVLTFFGKYVGTVKDNGLQFVNPLFTKQKVSLRLQSLESTRLKVNDKLGNPIEIAAVILWEIQDTYKVVFDVVNFSFPGTPNEGKLECWF